MRILGESMRISEESIHKIKNRCEFPRIDANSIRNFTELTRTDANFGGIDANHGDRFTDGGTGSTPAHHCVVQLLPGLCMQAAPPPKKLASPELRSRGISIPTLLPPLTPLPWSNCPSSPHSPQSTLPRSSRSNLPPCPLLHRS